MTLTVRGACHHDCPDACAWDVTVQDGVAVRLRGAPDHPHTAGQLCPKVNRFLDRVYHPDRVLHPLRRVGPKGSGSFEPISWSAAIAEIGSRWRQIIATDGAAAILPFSFDGTQGVIQKGVLARRLFAALGTSDIRRHLCGVSAWLGAADVCGTPFGIDPEDLRHSRTIVLWGTNTLLTNRHLWATIEEARANGATVVVIDPIRTITAEAADVHVQLRAGRDIELVLGLIHVLDRDHLLDAAWLADRTVGWSDLRSSAQPWTPAATAAATGVAAESIEWLARTFATQRPAAVRSLVGPEHQRNGREIMRAIATLPAVTGAWRDTGGGLARSTQVWWEAALELDREQLAPPAREFNMARLGEVLTDPLLDPPIGALYVHNANPATVVPDQANVLAGLMRDDLFTVVHEQFMTDTARHADIVLPATTQIEHLDLAPGWGHLYVTPNQPAIEPRGEARSNNTVFRLLATEMGLTDPALHETDETIASNLLAHDHPWLAGLSWDRLVDDGWGRFAIAPGTNPHTGTVFRLAALTPDPGAPPDVEHRFQLLSVKQHTKFLNANYAAFPAHHPEPPEPRVVIHPDDAAELGIDDTQKVKVANHRGSLTMAATIDDRVGTGTVIVPFGWHADAFPETMSINALTNPAVPDDDQGSAAFFDTWVSLTPVL